MKQTLWSHDFSIITIGTLISAIGGVAMNFAFSIVVFDQTSSTMLTGIFSAISFIPSIILPIIAAPYVDRCSRKKLIVRIDAGNGGLFLLFALFLMNHDFSYLSYLLFSFVTGCSNAVYSLAYQALYPDLIPKGFAQKGYAISSMIYPSVSALFTPIASMIYIHYGVAMICVLQGVLLLGASFFEKMIRFKEIKSQKLSHFSFKEYRNDFIQGFQYLKKEKGIRNIYTYMAITNATGNGVNMMTMAMFQSSHVLTTTMYALLTTAETLGRMIGGIVHYFIKIPYQKRYTVALRVYEIYQLLDCSLLLIAYPLMMINRFLAGFLGVNSLNIRESSTQSYLPTEMRARVSAFFNVFVSLGVMLVQLLTGALGELFSYQTVAVGLSVSCMVFIYVIVIRNQKEIKMIFNREV
ncbi:MFS transporter [[Eubacterium] hominis]|uniref:MFS transporter n=1 Tax=[Eubacterium] hominis TaxID=2764325 RepID=UPI003A4D2BD8